MNYNNYYLLSKIHFLVVQYLLFTQYFSRPHWAHRAGALDPHWQPPFTQHAQFCCWLGSFGCPCASNGSVEWPAFDVVPETLALPLPSLLLPFDSHEQGHPVDFLVQRSTRPAQTMEKSISKPIRKQCILLTLLLKQYKNSLSYAMYGKHTSSHRHCHTDVLIHLKLSPSLGSAMAKFMFSNSNYTNHL